MKYDVVIGLETHLELNTNTKVFCGCKNEFGSLPNTNTCPICTGFPGTLPLINKSAIDKTIIAGIVTNCTIANKFHFERKNYFYPDLPKAYQISQNDTPICKNGFIEIKIDDGSTKRIRINNIHLEEDSGKLSHSPKGITYIDYNRSGVPLIETVSEPDISSSAEAINYLNTLKNLYKAVGISDCKMEQGMLRCDVNISLKPAGSTTLGTRTEMKNINSFKAIERAINYEVNRQISILDEGREIEQVTMRWDDTLGQNFVMRNKQNADDYRYFREPDFYDFDITNEYINHLKNEIPKLPEEIKKELMNNYGISEYDSSLIVRDSTILDFFNQCVKLNADSKKIVNWITSEINKRLNLSFEEDTIINIKPNQLVEIITLLSNNQISQAGSRQIFDIIWNGSNLTVSDIILQNNLKLQDNSNDIEQVVKNIIDNNPKAVEDYKSGNQRALAFFVGQTMKALKGQARADKVNEIVKKLLG